MTTAAERVQALQALMKENHIDLYLVPTADYHQSEYVGEFFKARKFLTGFTGSAGTAVVTPRECCLWTDGRYFLQAEQELAGSGILLQRMGEPGVPSIEAYLAQHFPQGGVLGFDGRCVSLAAGRTYEKIAREKKGRIEDTRDLVGELWQERPSPSKAPAFLLDICYAGESVQAKLTRLRKVMEKEGVDRLLVTTLDDICWLLNIRGGDVAYSPLLLSYLLLDREQVEFYVDGDKLSGEIRAALEKEGVVLYPYEEIYRRLSRLSKERVGYDESRINYRLYRQLPKEVQGISFTNPIMEMKCIKNDTEIENLKKAHIKDGIAHTRFLYWLKQNIGKIPMTELSVSDQLVAFRKEQEGYLYPSFAPICAYKEHGAVIHYSATLETNVALQPGGLFLSDTGGHYYEGSTDITRTVALGDISREERRHFTLVLCGMLRLADVIFPAGCSGRNLDCIARVGLWREGLDFRHGTGHGVGYLGTIHEPPIRFYWNASTANAALQPGMVITDEPGIYIPNSHGIRLENELLVVEKGKTEYGSFFGFEPLTVVPFDLEALDLSLMSEEEKILLNRYHRKVYDTLSPYFAGEEKTWLANATREI